MLVVSKPSQAAAILDRVVDRFQSQSFHLLLSEVLQLRARARLTLGDLDGAEIDLEAALAELEDLRSARDSGMQQITLLDRHREVYDLMVRLQVDARKNAAEAHFALERGRARLLLDSLGRIQHQALDRLDSSGLSLLPRRFADLQEDLPIGARVVQYHLQTDRLLIWMLTREGLTLTTVAVPAVRIGHLVETVTRPGSEGQLIGALAELYNYLIKPVDGELVVGQPLVLVLEGTLFRLPFGALVDSESGRYLLEDHALSMAPSFNSLFALRPFTEGIPVGARVLAVADPAFHPEIFPQLDRLLAARGEAEEIVQLFPGSRLLEDRAATREALLSAAGRFEVVHLASHAFADPAAPFRSRLLLAPDEGDDGVLYAWELLGVDFGRTRLAVLAACDTGGGNLVSEGVAGLVWPWLAAGVPQVLAALRPVDDGDTAALMEDFYHLLAVRQDPIMALQRAQQEALLRDDRDPKRAVLWASFQLYGTPFATTEPAQSRARSTHRAIGSERR